ncbi:Retrovirus-related Pol polyprotein from transposon TNT 1-94, partial [Nymphaea thermarum]
MDQPNSSILSSSFLSQLIFQKLNHSNYLTWKRQIVPFIKSHRLYGHIDGTTPAPPQYIDREVKRTVVADQGGGASTGCEIRFEYETVTENNPTYEVWLAHDQSLVAYITYTLSEEVLGGVDDDLTALELWSTLATTYSQVSEARFLQLRRQFQDIKRGTCTVLEYLNEIKSVSDQLAAIGHLVSDKDKVQQALSGLGTEFDIFCTALEVLPILPSFEDLKAKFFQHEASCVQRQNLITSNNHNVLITWTHTMQGHRTRPWTPQAGMGRGILPTPPGTNTTSSMPRRIPTCFYCNKRGHVKSECWHNPQNKNNHIRRGGKAAAGAASSSSGQNVTSNIPADAQQLLMTAISKLQLKQNEQGEWYVDSGAAAHVIGDAGQGSVVTGDGSHHTISHIGNARISMGNSSIPLKNVLVVLSVKKNIISVSKLIDDTHSSVEFTPSSVYVKDVQTKKTFAEGTRKGD